MNKHENKKKTNEINCIKNILSYKSKNNYCASLKSIIFDNNIANYAIFERPDFILKKDNTIFGYEHFTVDLFLNNENGSFYRQNQTNVQRIVNSERNEAKDIEFLRKNILDRSNVKTEFDYNKFINGFSTIARKHNDNCVFYKDNIKNKYNEDFIELTALIDIPLNDCDFTYTLIKGKKEHNQRIVGIPFTSDIINIIKGLNNFNFAVILVHSEDNTIVYFFDIKNIDLSIKMQNIKIHDSFYFKSKFKIENLQIEKQDKNYTFIPTIKIK